MYLPMTLNERLILYTTKLNQLLVNKFHRRSRDTGAPEAHLHYRADARCRFSYPIDESINPNSSGVTIL